jgi:hypothetical protein
MMLVGVCRLCSVAAGIVPSALASGSPVRGQTHREKGEVPFTHEKLTAETLPVPVTTHPRRSPSEVPPLCHGVTREA